MSGWQIAGMVALVALAVVGIALAKRPRRQREKITRLSAAQLGEIPQEEQALLEELYEKAQRDYLAVEHARTAVRDERLAASLARLQPLSARIMDYLGQHPQKIMLARKFIDYYQDRAAKLAAEYQELERTELRTAQVEETKQSIREMIASFEQAYTAAFEKLLTEKLLDVDAELRVMEQTLDAEGIERVKEPDAQAETAPAGTGAPDAGARGAEVPSAGVQDASDAGRQDDAQVAGTPGTGVPGASEADAPGWRGSGAARQTLAGAPWQHRPGIGRGRRIERRHDWAERAVIPLPLVSDVRRQRLVMGVLAILLGTFGAHKFYQGRIGMGLLYMAFCGTAIPTIVGFCEGIRYLTMPLERFYEKVYRP